MPIYRSSKKPIILVTMGHPTGIGPEVTLKALSGWKVFSRGSFLIIGDGCVIKGLVNRLSPGLKIHIIKEKYFRKRSLNSEVINLLDMANIPKKSFSFGSLDPAFGGPSIEYIEKAVELVKSGFGDAVVTAPINKSSAKKSGFKFPGHTEYLAHLTNTKNFAMMFIGGPLKVALVTRHIPLKDVPSALTVDSICEVIGLTYDGLKNLFKIRRPRIGVCGVNPHAGEGGFFGREELVIKKAIKNMSLRIKSLSGPRPPDTIFHEAYNKKFDAVVAMYHDQALIPLKMLYFDKGVNLTLGLPFIRTSPDHGTALDIAGRCIANPGSMKEAIKLACMLASP